MTIQTSRSKSTQEKSLFDKIPVGISSCLLGNEVRYNGGHKRDSYITGTLSEYFDLRPLCPEVGIGLTVPRPPIRLVVTDGGIRAQGVKDSSLDVTDRLRLFSRQQRGFCSKLSGFILKKDSPSCGMERVKLFNKKGMPQKQASGIFAQELMTNFPQLPVEEEGRLGDPRLRENFIQRVFIYHHWRQLGKKRLTVKALTDFHAQHKFTLMSHNQKRCRELGRLASEANAKNLANVADQYIREVMATLKILATRKNHVNVLQHIMGFLKKQLDTDDKQELLDIFDSYYRGDTPLIVPVTLLKHHFRRSPDDYIASSRYLTPYPEELRLRNLL